MWVSWTVGQVVIGLLLVALVFVGLAVAFFLLTAWFLETRP
jgi:hypothetical protein